MNACVRVGVQFLQALNYFPRYGYSMFDKLTRDGGVTYMTTVTLIFQSDDADGSTHQENPKITYIFLNKLIWLKFRIKPF